MFPQYEYRDAELQVIGRHTVKTYPPRFHKHVELGLLDQGSLDVNIDGQSYRMEAGDLYVVFPNLLHAVTRADGRLRLVLAGPELFASQENALSQHKLRCPILRKEERPSLVEALFLRLDELYRADPVRHRALLYCHTRSLLQEVLEDRELEVRSSDGALVQQLMVYLLANYTEDISLEDVALHLGYSKYHLSHVICDTFGCNFRRLLNSYRVSLAQNLLLTTAQSASQVAFACGFKNQSSFNRVFLEQCGMTPSAFRRQKNGEQAEPQLYRK